MEEKSHEQSPWTNRSRVVRLPAGRLVMAVLAATAAARDGYVTSFDGTKIVYSFFPDPSLQPGQRAPTVMFGPGYSSARSSSSDATVQALLANGYNVLTWDPRGFGDSTGDVELDSPAYEARDVSALIDLIAQQPEAQLDKPGDPRLGMVGASYGGGIQLTSAEIDPRDRRHRPADRLELPDHRARQVEHGQGRLGQSPHRPRAPRARRPAACWAAWRANRPVPT